ncbi:1170_t:CDS:2 [Entrophospora sp. SA101]|nr:1170_t:CDS:2 [Entrophospora sp. SA101]
MSNYYKIVSTKIEVLATNYSFDTVIEFRQISASSQFSLGKLL